MPAIPSFSDACRLRDFLRAANYTEDGFRQKPFLQELPSQQAGNLPWLLDATADPTAFNVLARLFLFGMPQAVEAVDAVVPEPVRSILATTGIAKSDGSWIVPTVMLAPVGDLIITADPLFRMQPEQAPDLVVWPNETTRLLLNLSLRTPCESTLDLGTGCGVIAVSAAQFSAQVVATDLNARAAEFVPFNAWLNSTKEIETIIGDAFAPVDARRFDRILANPPFFITPSSDVLYCENPLELDGFCRRVAREGAAHLNEGGFLQMLFEWVQVQGEPWQDRLSAWLDDTGCDAWILRTYAGAPDSYAHQRTAKQYSISPEKATRDFERSMEYYRRHRVEQVLGGLMVLRRRSGRNWVRMEEGRVQPGQPFGDLITDVFNTQDVLRDMTSDELLLALKPRLSPQARLEQRFTVENGAWAYESIRLTLDHGLPAAIAVESAVADFLARCDGSRSLDQLVRDIAAKVRVDPEQVGRQCCAVVRKLAERRFISFA